MFWVTRAEVELESVALQTSDFVMTSVYRILPTEVLQLIACACYKP